MIFSFGVFEQISLFDNVAIVIFCCLRKSQEAALRYGCSRLLE